MVSGEWRPAGFSDPLTGQMYRGERQIGQGSRSLDERPAPHPGRRERQDDRGADHEEAVPADEDEPGVGDRGEAIIGDQCLVETGILSDRVTFDLAVQRTLASAEE